MRKSTLIPVVLMLSNIAFLRECRAQTPTTLSANSTAVEECLEAVRQIHGGAGPWAVVGYRIGQRALSELGLAKQSHDLVVLHRSPAQVQFSCIADGVQAATGASAGKLNLRLEESSEADLSTLVENRETGRKLRFTIQPRLKQTIYNLPMEQGRERARQIAAMPDDEVFQMTEIVAARRN